MKNQTGLKFPEPRVRDSELMEFDERYEMSDMPSLRQTTAMQMRTNNFINPSTLNEHQSAS